MCLRILILQLIVLLSFSAHASDVVCQKPWNIGIYESPPFQSMKASVNGGAPEAIGLQVDIMKMVAVKLGCKINFQAMPWKRQQALAETGEIDIVMGQARRKAREASIHFLSPFLDVPSVFIIKKADIGKYDIPDNPNASNPNFDRKSLIKLKELADIKSIHNYRAGAIIGINYNDAYGELLKDPDFASHIKLVTNNVSNFLKLINGRVEGVFFSGLPEYIETAKSVDAPSAGYLYPLNLGNDFIYMGYAKKSFSLEQAKKIDAVMLQVLKAGQGSPGIEALMRKNGFSDLEIQSMVVK